MIIITQLALHVSYDIALYDSASAGESYLTRHAKLALLSQSLPDCSTQEQIVACATRFQPSPISIHR
jgi:hypothetical protein